MGERSDEPVDGDESDDDTSPIFAGQRVSKGRRRDRRVSSESDGD